MLIDLSSRSKDYEIMDDFNNPPENLKEILQDINRVNYMLGGFNITINTTLKIINQNFRNNYTIVDFACADGSMLRTLALICRKKGIKSNFIGVDLNEKALQIAKRESQDYPEIHYLNRDIFEMDFKESGCDIIISTLTLHHFNDGQVKKLMRYFIEKASLGVIINDLQRSSWAYYLFKLFSLFFVKTDIAKTDGLTSIKRAFKKEELMSFTEALPGFHQIKWKWAFRYLWIVNKNNKTYS